MNKELEEAKEYINYQIKTENLVRGYTDIYYFQEELKILLNYIENSIPKKKVEKLLNYDKANYINCIKSNNKMEAIRHYIEHLEKELLEWK